MSGRLAHTIVSLRATSAPTACRRQRRSVHCATPNDLAMSARRADLSYIETWFASIVKSKTFYDEQSSTDQSTRCYFYNTDLQGRLFLEEVLPKNTATAIKDARFLNLFFSRLRRVTLRDHDFMEERGISLQDYPFVSPCGKELNFVRPAAATPVVFHSLVPSDTGDGRCLGLAGSLQEPFSPHHLAISVKSGRLYHRLTSLDLNSRFLESPGILEHSSHDFGLVRSSVAVGIADHMLPLDGTTPGPDANAEQLSGWLFQREGQVPVSIPKIPAQFESGLWMMPIEYE